MFMYGCNFYCELALVLSQVPLKTKRAELRIDVIYQRADNETIQIPPRMTDVIFNSGQTCNTQNSTMTLEQQVGKYQSDD